MKRILLALLLLPGLCFARQNRYEGSQNVRVEASDTLNGSMFTGGQYIELRGPIRGDVYAAGQQIGIEGGVEDDVHAAGQDLLISGKVGDTVVFFGGTARIDGEIGGDLLVFSGVVSLSRNTRILGNVYVNGGVLHMEGAEIHGWMRGQVGEAWLAGTIHGPVRLEAITVRFDEDYKAPAGTQLRLQKPLASGFQPEGLETEVIPPLPFYRTGFFYWSFFALLLTGIVFVLLLPDLANTLTAFAPPRALPVMGAGLIFAIVAPLLLAFATIFVVTIPLVIVGAMLYVLLLYIGYAIAGVILGGMLMKRVGRTAVPLPIVLVPGLAVVVLAAKLPFIGWLLGWAATCFGAGAVVLYVWEAVRRRQKTA